MKFGPKPETVSQLKEAATSSVTYLVIAILGAGAMVFLGLVILAGAINGST